MKVPRIQWNDEFYCFVDDNGVEITNDEIVTQYNILAERIEVILDDMEEILNGVAEGTSRSIYQGPLSDPQRSADSA